MKSTGQCHMVEERIVLHYVYIFFTAVMISLGTTDIQ